jgi:hypothetical protein
MTMPMPSKGAVDLGKIHRKFEQKFCADLRASGSANLANARDCSFFLNMPGQPDQNMPIQVAESFHTGKKSCLHGAVQDFS